MNYLIILALTITPSIVKISSFDFNQFNTLIGDSYQNCLGNFNFLWNSKEHCQYGKQLLEENIDFEFDLYSRSGKIASAITLKNEQKKCYSARLVYELGKCAEYLLENCENKSLSFTGIFQEPNTYLFTLKCKYKNSK
jgi:hypothetical protein